MDYISIKEQPKLLRHINSHSIVVKDAPGLQKAKIQKENILNMKKELEELKRKMDEFSEFIKQHK